MTGEGVEFIYEVNHTARSYHFDNFLINFEQN